MCPIGYVPHWILQDIAFVTGHPAMRAMSEEHPHKRLILPKHSLHPPRTGNTTLQFEHPEYGTYSPFSSCVYTKVGTYSRWRVHADHRVEVHPAFFARLNGASHLERGFPQHLQGVRAPVGGGTTADLSRVCDRGATIESRAEWATKNQEVLNEA